MITIYKHHFLQSNTSLTFRERFARRKGFWRNPLQPRSIISCAWPSMLYPLERRTLIPGWISRRRSKISPPDNRFWRHRRRPPVESRDNSLVDARRLHNPHPSVDLRPGHRPGQLLLVHHHISPSGRPAEPALCYSFIVDAARWWTTGDKINLLTKLFP